MCTQFFRKRLFVLASAERDGIESHLPRILNSEMSQSADAVHGHNFAAARPRIAERVIDRDARAHERPRFLGWQFIRNCGERGRRCDHVFGISAIEIEARDFAIDTHCEIAVPALRADETMSAMPPHADALTFLPFCDAVADRV